MNSARLDSLKRTRDKRLVSSVDPRGSLESAPGSVDMPNPKPRDPHAEGQADATIAGLSGDLPEENLDPLRPRIHKITGRRRSFILHGLAGWFKAAFLAVWTRRPGRALSADEAAEAAERARRRAMEKLLRQEADLFMDRIVNALTRLGMCYLYPKSQKDLFVSGVQAVQFDHAVLMPDAIYLRINTRRLPRGVNVLRLMDPEVITDLSLACGHTISAEYTEKIGAWYIVARASGVRGIPNHVKYQEMLDTFPKTADELTIPLGMTTNSKKLYRSIKDMPHLLVAGSTDTGKSNQMNVIIGTLIMRNKRDTLRLVMVDLKGGMEFTFYEGLPHLLPIPGVTESGIIYDREQVPDCLGWLIREGERRMAVIKEAGHKNIGNYNSHRTKNRMARIILVIDEWADVKLARSVGNKSEDMLSNIAGRMRAVGIHVLLATQSPKKEVISTIIKSNLNAKMAFSCPSYTASQLILDVGDAKGLSPQGRYIYQKGNEQFVVQAPYMPDTMIQEIVSASITGKITDLQVTDVTEQEVLEYALDHLDGKLSYSKIYPQFKNRIPQLELRRWMQAWDNNQFEIRGNRYIVKPSDGGSKPRELVRMEDDNAEPTP